MAGLPEIRTPQNPNGIDKELSELSGSLPKVLVTYFPSCNARLDFPKANSPAPESLTIQSHRSPLFSILIFSIRAEIIGRTMFRTTQDLIPNIIRRKKSRERPYAIIAGIDGSRQVVTFADLENWSNRAALFLDKLPGKQVLYMGPNDIRYALWAIAAIKTGKCVSLWSAVARKGVVLHIISRS